MDESDLAGNAQEEYVFFGGRRIARRDVSTNVVHYYFSDHLGSHTVISNAAGTQTEQDIDYYPYGGQQNDYSSAPVAQHYKFNGKERDTETGLDNFGARYDASNLGRFMTPDWSAKPVAVPYAHYGNPQSLNLYSYVENNPTTFGDPDGHVPVGCSYFDVRQCANRGKIGEPNANGQDNQQHAMMEAFLRNAEHTWEVAQDKKDKEREQKQSQQKKNAAPANSRTDVVLYGRESTPTPTRETNWFWVMDWYAGSCSSNDICTQTSANEKQTISLVEKSETSGWQWKPTGDPRQGEAHDQISPEPRTFFQRWYVDNKQVQLVVGKDSNGNLVKAWEVQVVIGKFGDTPVYSPVQ